VICNEAIDIFHKLWQASAVEVNECYLNQCNPYGEDLEV